MQPVHCGACSGCCCIPPCMASRAGAAHPWSGAHDPQSSGARAAPPQPPCRAVAVPAPTAPGDGVGGSSQHTTHMRVPTGRAGRGDALMVLSANTFSPGPAHRPPGDAAAPPPRQCVRVNARQCLPDDGVCRISHIHIRVDGAAGDCRRNLQVGRLLGLQSHHGSTAIPLASPCNLVINPRWSTHAGQPTLVNPRWSPPPPPLQLGRSTHAQQQRQKPELPCLPLLA
jgi:hypothetical protein